MRKLLLALAVASMSTAAFSLDLAFLDKYVGVGIRASPYFETAKAELDSSKSFKTYRTVLYGACAYFDATYVQVSVGLDWASANSATRVVDELSIFGGGSDKVTSPSITRDYLSFGLLLKYPFDMTGFYVFPILGLEYDLNLVYKDASGNDLKADMDKDEVADLNMLWIKAGVGLDIPIAKRIYLRPEVLGSYKLRSKLEKDWIAEEESAGMDSASYTTIKVDIGFLLGYQFY
jgi:hypothetical protein